MYCIHCFSTSVEECDICDICECRYCYDCSYTYSLHYQFQGSRCYMCADQSRRTKLPLDDKRVNAIKLLTNE